MSLSLLFYLDHGDRLHVIDSASLQHYEDKTPPLIEVAIAFMRAGYEGVRIDEQQLSDGRYFHAVNANIATPEGRAIEVMGLLHESGRPLPRTEVVLEAVRLETERRAQGQREGGNE